MFSQVPIVDFAFIFLDIEVRCLVFVIQFSFGLHLYFVLFVGTDIESASEVEDSGVSLHSVTKEQLFQYFRKMQRRSEKYKSKFTQIYQVYRDLERERDKLRVS